jgi:hypothetical protein
VFVVYTPGNPGYDSTRQYRSSPSATAGGARGTSASRSVLVRNLQWAVVLLGLVAYGFSFGPVGDSGGALGWNVRFALLATLWVGFSLLAQQKVMPAVTATLAAIGFLDGVSVIFTGGDSLPGGSPGWALTVIVGLNLVQTAAAIAALLLTPADDAKPGVDSDYQMYVDYYNEAMRQYYGQPSAPAVPPSSQQSGYGQATYGAIAGAQRNAAAERGGQYADYTDVDYGVPSQHLGGQYANPYQQQTHQSTSGIPESGRAQRPAAAPHDPGADAARQPAPPAH